MIMSYETPRFALPQLVTAQAQKEVTHNEALALIDALLHPAIEAVTTAPPAVSASDAGKCWLVAANATGAFSGKADCLAYWTGGSWRFANASDGMAVWHRADRCVLRFATGQWHLPATISPPSGGANIDAECRAVVANLIAQLVEAGTLRGA